MIDREKLIDVFMHLDRHIKNRDEYGICYTSDFVEAVETVLQMLKNGAAVPQWIPVTKRLPEDGELVWAWSESLRDLGLGVLDEFESSQVTHWMPLPEPPEDGGNNED